MPQLNEFVFFLLEDIFIENQHIVIGTRCYIIQYGVESATGEIIWQSQIITKSKFTLRHLQSGKKYQVKVAAVGINEQLLYTEPVFKIVQ